MDEITKELLDALKTIESWNSHTTAYAVDFGSNGVRDFYRAIARQSIAKAEATLAAPQPADDGWIPWNGGDCPVEVGTRVDVRYRDGWEGDGLASKWRWHHATQESSDVKGGSSRAQAIKSKCLSCANLQREEVRMCPVVTCPLHSVRPYQQGEQDQKDAESE